MPSMEDENSVNVKQSELRPLCPFCGSPDVYRIKGKTLLFFTRTVGWSCANERCRMYRKTFHSPSRGSLRRRRR